jgi:hypothetical protein
MRNKILPTAFTAGLIFGTPGFCVAQGAQDSAPGQKMQDKGSVDLARLCERGACSVSTGDLGVPISHQPALLGSQRCMAPVVNDRMLP